MDHPGAETAGALMFFITIGLICMFISIPIILHAIRNELKEQTKIMRSDLPHRVEMEVHLKLCEMHLGKLASFFDGRNVELSNRQSEE